MLYLCFKDQPLQGQEKHVSQVMAFNYGLFLLPSSTDRLRNHDNLSQLCAFYRAKDKAQWETPNQNGAILDPIQLCPNFSSELGWIIYLWDAYVLRTFFSLPYVVTVHLLTWALHQELIVDSSQNSFATTSQHWLPPNPGSRWNNDGGTQWPEREYLHFSSCSLLSKGKTTMCAYFSEASEKF